MGLFRGVSDGTRTRDILDHNQVLYQLSYTHHDRRSCNGFPYRPRKSVQGPKGCSRQAFPGPGGPRRGRYRAGSTCLAAIARAVSESGPGCGTKIASR